MRELWGMPLTEAMELSARALEDNPKDPQIWARHAWVHLATGKDLEQAQDALQKATTLAPDSAWAWFILSQLHMLRARHSDAVSCLRRVIELDSTWTSGTVALSIALTCLDDHAEAEAILRESLCHQEEADAGLRSSSDPSLHNTAAWSLYRHGPSEMLEKAEGWAATAVDANPEEPYRAHTHGCILAALGRTQEALDTAEVYLASPECVRKTQKDAVTLFVELAAHGAAAPALAQLEASPSADILETLIVALRREIGDDTPAPHELAEVARDIRADIQRRRDELATQSRS